MTILILMLMALGTAVGPVLAAPPSRTLTYQGILTDAEEPVGGQRQLTFALYETATGGNPIFTEMQQVEVTDGVFSVELGAEAGNTFADNGVDFSEQYWLAISAGADQVGERIKLTAAPYVLGGTVTGVTGFAVAGEVLRGEVALDAGANVQLTVDNGRAIISATGGPGGTLEDAYRADATINTTRDDGPVRITGDGGLELDGSELQLADAGDPTFAIRRRTADRIEITGGEQSAILQENGNLGVGFPTAGTDNPNAAKFVVRQDDTSRAVRVIQNAISASGEMVEVYYDGPPISDGTRMLFLHNSESASSMFAFLEAQLGNQSIFLLRGDGSMRTAGMVATEAGFAQRFTVGEPCFAGDVLVFTEGSFDQVVRASNLADPLVVGVCDTDIGPPGTATVITMGAVDCQVRGGPTGVDPGDLLVTAPMQGGFGHATKAPDPPRPGTVLGKALEQVPANMVATIKVYVSPH